MVDFGLIRQPDIAGGAINALGQGRQVGMEDARRRILSGYNNDRAGSIDQLLAIDPDTALRMQQSNRVEKADARAGDQQDREAEAAGHRTIAGLLTVIQRQSRDPNERRSMAMHVVDQLVSQLPPEAGERLRQQAQQFGYTDADIENYVATFKPDTGADNVEVNGEIVNRRTGRVIYQSDRPTITPFGIIEPRRTPGAGRTPLAVTDGSADEPAAPPRSVASNGPVSFQAPVNGRVSSEFGPRRPPMPGASANHHGRDYAVPEGTPIQAAADGVVIPSVPGDGLGTSVRVRHHDGSISIYGHLSSTDVAPGTQVAAGQQIGRSGRTGTATGPNMHFEVLDPNGRPVDPRRYLQGRAGAVPSPPPAPDQAAPNPDAGVVPLGDRYQLRPMRTPQQEAAERHQQHDERVADERLGLDRRRADREDRQGHVPTEAERRQFRGADWINADGSPHYPPRGAGGVGESQAPGDSSLTGRDYLATLPQAMQRTVVALAEGRQSFTNIPRDQRQAYIDAVGQYDPSFDAVNYNSRQRTQNEFTAGQAGRTINSLNTAIGHMETLQRDIQALGNGNVQGFNAVRNWARTQFGDPAVTNFETTREAVVSELVRVYRGAGGAEADMERALSTFSANASQQQLMQALQRAADLLESRVQALETQYNTGMSTTGHAVPGLSPHAREALTSMRTGRPMPRPAAAAPRPSSPPAPRPAPRPAAPARPAAAGGAHTASDSEIRRRLGL